MIILIYTVIIILATTLGAISGLGGGVIIKPLFDAVGFHNMSTIGFYSSVAVFTMSIVSIIKQLRKGFSFEIKTVFWISFGSLVGGIIGENVFNEVTRAYENSTVKIIQAVCLGITLIGILIYTLNKNKMKSYCLKNILYIFASGFFLGSISVFLGIGGGPLNIAVLMLLFSYEMKEATVYSIATIFFAQISKLGSVLVGGKLMNYDLSLLPFICCAAVIGGFMGTLINQKLNSSKIEKIYLGIIIGLIFVSIYNAYSAIV